MLGAAPARRTLQALLRESAAPRALHLATSARPSLRGLSSSCHYTHRRFTAAAAGIGSSLRHFVNAPWATNMATASHVLDKLISDLENDLGLSPGEPLPSEKKKTQPAQKKEKKQQKPASPKAKKAASAPAAAADQPEATKLDIRVGKIVNVWRHETADKLYCEEIDVGEEQPRQIASGLVPHYTLEEMKDRRILVLCNLKPKNLVGFKSNGMVMCAAIEGADGKEKVEFVEPPEDAEIGERIKFDELEGEPITAAQVEKKKVLQNVFPDLTTDGSGVAKWKGHVFLTSAGPCRAPTIVNGLIR